MNDAPLISIRGVAKIFEGGRLRALDGVDLDIAAGEFIAIVGPSGCGKSTLLHLIAALDHPEEGTITVAGHNLGRGRQLNHYRAQDVGIVFQLDNLLPTLTASENIQVPMFGQGLSGRDRHARAEALLAQVGLSDRLHYRPPQMSGGERQRVAIARALANDPKIVLADEPTGRLDSASGKRVLALLKQLRDERGLTIILVTHDPTVAAQADRVVSMLDGRVVDAPASAAPAAAPAGH
jgi:putative ABC transport system ATP-binding protein